MEWLQEPVSVPRWLDLLPWFLIGVVYVFARRRAS